MSAMRRSPPACLIAIAIAIATSGHAHEIKSGNFEIFHPSAPATVGEAKNAVVFMTIDNRGAAPDRLVGAESPIAERVELHRHETEDGATKMRPVDAVDLPPGTSVKLTASGVHLMMFGLRRALVEYGTFPMTLIFERAGRVDVEVQIDEAGATEPTHQ
jgi:periplasmic copper chaperone A